MTDKPTLFISYSHKDEEHKDFVVSHLRVAERQGVFDVWDDRRIKGGGDWLAEIDTARAKADVAILLISRHFLTSDFIMDYEVQTLLRNRTSDGLKLYPILISDCTWQRVDWLQAINIRPRDGTPLNSFNEAERDQVMTDLASEIAELLDPVEGHAATRPSLASSALAPRLGRLYGDIPKLPSKYHEREEHLSAIRGKILDASKADGIVGVKKGTAIQGMGGVGKTVLAAAAIDSDDISASFPDGIFWLALGQAPNTLLLQQRLLSWIAPDVDPPADVQEGRDSLDTLLKTKRALIVLDDVWRLEDLHAFEIADTPSRLLITTRDEGIVRSSGATHHVVDELTHEAARAFLAEAVGLDEIRLPEQADTVIEECGRLPLALSLAGATLADAPEDPSLWQDVTNSLASPYHEQLEQEFDYPYPHPLAAIQASVDFLSDEDREAYLQLAIFAEDAAIPLAPLEKLWGLKGLNLRNRVKLFVDRALARRRDNGAIVLHDLQGDFVRHRCPDLPAAHKALLSRYQSDEKATWADIPDDGYLLDWLPHHLLGAGRDEELHDLLFNIQWLQRKLSARGANALVADTLLIRDDDEIEQLGRALRMSEHVLNRQPKQLTAQLIGRLHQDEGERMGRLIKQAETLIPCDVLAPVAGRHLLSPGALTQTFEGHSSWVNGAVLLNDYERALSWSADSTLRLWNLDNGQSQPLEGHSGAVNGAVLFQGGKRALSWSADSTLRLWNLDNGQSQLLEGHSDTINGVVLFEDGKRALSWSADSTLRLWNLGKGQSQLLEGHSDAINGVVLFEDGKRALSWSADSTLRLWNLDNGQSQPLEGHSDAINGVVLFEDGKRALSWSADSTLRLWNLDNGQSQLLEGHSDAINGVVLFEDGKRALSWSKDGTLRLWNLGKGQSQGLEGHGSPVMGALLSNDGMRALSWAFDNILRLWDLNAGQSQKLKGDNRPIRNAALSNDGMRALSWSGDPWSGDPTLRLWNLDNGQSQDLEGHSNAVNGAVFLDGGKRALSWSYDNTLRLWNLDRGRSRGPEEHSSSVRGVLLSNDGKRALSWASDNTLRLWDLDKGQSRRLGRHGSSVRSVALSNDGKRALSWSKDSTLHLWDLDKGQSRGLEGHSRSVIGAILSNDGKRALSWAGDNTLRLWDLDTCQSQILEEHHFSVVVGALLSNDGKRALSWSGDLLSRHKTFRLWDLDNGQSNDLKGHRTPVDGALFLDDGRRALSWAADSTLRLWDLNTSQSKTIGEQSRSIKGVMLSNNGRRALSWAGDPWSSDSTLRLWDLNNGQSRLLEGHSGSVKAAVLSDDGRRAVSWSNDSTLHLWDLDKRQSGGLEGHSRAVMGAMISNNAKHALSWASDNTLRLWDLETLEEMQCFVGDDPLTACVLSDDGRLAVVGDRRGRVMRFVLPAT